MVNALDRAFADLIVSLQEIVRLVDPALLYRPAAGGSVGEQVLRSAAAIEQTFGGLTANLWDDPFEWTLPETLSTPALIIEYLSEVDASRERVFNAIDDDAALSKYVSVPSGESRPLIDPLIETLVRASDYRGRAVSHQKAQEGTKDFTA
ncbi:MAG TPA: hypothetical protein VL907_05820 [Pyrinomonadaceae bacterium]|nr:hypothetical protein [Pyrinomonadaceae bacterium]